MPPPAQITICPASRDAPVSVSHRETFISNDMIFLIPARGRVRTSIQIPPEVRTQWTRNSPAAAC